MEHLENSIIKMRLDICRHLKNEKKDFLNAILPQNPLLISEHI